jgi:hypothetical protein
VNLAQRLAPESQRRAVLFEFDDDTFGPGLLGESVDQGPWKALLPPGDPRARTQTSAQDVQRAFAPLERALHPSLADPLTRMWLLWETYLDARYHLLRGDCPAARPGWQRARALGVLEGRGPLPATDELPLVLAVAHRDGNDALEFSDEEEAGSVELSPNITAELNDEGELIGIEILESIDFDLRETLDDMNDLMAIKAAEKSIEYVYLIDHDVPSRLKGDPGRLRQILINLIGNAINLHPRAK